MSIRCPLFPSLQNLKMEIDGLQSKLNLLDKTNLSEEKKPILNECKERLKDVKVVFAWWPTRGLQSLYIWTSIHWVYQRLLAIQTLEEVRAEVLKFGGRPSFPPATQRRKRKRGSVDRRNGEWTSEKARVNAHLHRRMRTACAREVEALRKYL